MESPQSADGGRNHNTPTATSDLTEQDTLDSQLFRAVDSRDRRLVNRLIAQNANPNGYRDELTCLHLAIRSDWYGAKSTKRLTNIADVYPTFSITVHTGVTKDDFVEDFALVQDLLRAGADVTAVDWRGNTCLHYAIETDHWGKLTETLLSAGANSLINRQNMLGQSVLHLAVQAVHRMMDGCRQVLVPLIAAGADVSLRDYLGRTCLHFCNQINLAELEILLNAPSASRAINRLDLNGLNPFLIAVRDCGIDAVKLMLDRGADVNFHSRRLSEILNDASEQELCAIREHWMPHRYDGTIADIYFFFERLIEPDAEDSDRRIGTPLHMAAFYGHADKVEALLEYGANANAVNRDGLSVISLAARSFRQNHNHKKTLEILYLYGADVNDGGNGIRTPFEIALREGSWESVEFFIKLENEGVVETPKEPILYIASKNIRNGHIIMKNLLAGGLSRVDVKNSHGLTALHRISRDLSDSARLRAQVLLRAGADVDVRNDEDHTSLELAIANKNEPIVKLHIRHMTLREKMSPGVNLISDEIITRNETCRKLYNDCKSELDRLSSHAIDESITYYSILINQKYICARNDRAMNEPILLDQNCVELEKLFPTYYDEIRMNFVEMKRLELIENAMHGLELVVPFKHDAFPRICYQILNYLSDRDLINVCDVAPHRD